MISNQIFRGIERRRMRRRAVSVPARRIRVTDVGRAKSSVRPEQCPYGAVIKLWEQINTKAVTFLTGRRYQIKICTGIE
jgi:hypothetical protein